MRSSLYKSLKIVCLIFIILFAIFENLVFMYAIFSSFKPPEEIVRPKVTLLPEKPTIINYIRLFKETYFVRAFLISLLISAITTTGVIITGILTAYALAKQEFLGRDAITRFNLYLLTIPQYLFLIPTFYIIVKLKLINNLLALLIPSIVSPYTIFLLRQYIVSIPDDFIDAARVDGASEWYIVFKIVFPMIKPAIIVVALWTFVGSWGNFLWPLVVIHDPQFYPLATYMNTLQSAYGDYRYTGVVMAGTVLGFLPMVLILIFGFKYITRGITLVAIRR